MNSPRVNLEKTQVTAFHLRNKEANRSLKVVWNETELENAAYPKYLGVTLDRSVCYKQYIQNTKIKVTTRNNLLTKLATSKWGANPSTIRMTALALSYSTAEFTAPVVWTTNFEDLYSLPGIAPSTIRRDVCARVERQKQSTRETHSLACQIPATKRLKSRHCFLSSVVQPAYFTLKVFRCSEWQERLCNKPHIGIINLHKEMMKGYDSPWTTCKFFHRLRTGYTCSKSQRKKNHGTHVTVLATCTSLLFG